jgi:hypothetical protein
MRAEHETGIVLDEDEPVVGIDDETRDLLVIGPHPGEVGAIAIRHDLVEEADADLQPRAVPADRGGFQARQARRVHLIDGERTPARGQVPQGGDQDERAAGDQDGADQKAPHGVAWPVREWRRGSGLACIAA